MRGSLRRALLVPLVAVLALTACESSTGLQATSPTDGSTVGITASSDDKVTGGGHYVDDVQGTQDGWRNFGFNARVAPDGTVTGQIQLKNRSLDALAHGVVTCLTIDGNQAWIGGTFTDVKPPFDNLDGVDFGFFAIDNGSGSSNPADILSNTLTLPSGFFGIADAADYCAQKQEAPGPPFVFDIESGNITIH